MAPDEAPGLPPAARVDAVWRALDALGTFAAKEDDAAVRQAVAAARTACPWAELRELLEVSLAGSPEPFKVDPTLARALEKEARARDLSVTSWEGVSTLEFSRVQLNNNSRGISGRLFPRAAGTPDASPHALLALAVAEEELGDEYEAMTAQERLEWLQEDTAVLSGPWQPMSWFNALETLASMLAGNYGARATDHPGRVDAGHANPVSLADALKPLGRFVRGASGEFITLLQFERAWWLLALRL